jgi:adenine-specific DNA-methyltransferase
LVRDRIYKALKAENPDHPVISTLSDDDARAWATRQLGRILFLWFLQSKEWLGYNWPEYDKSHYLLTLWSKRDQAGGYYNGLMKRLFFEAMARRTQKEEVRDLLGYIPYLNGGLFRTNRLEDRIDSGGDFVLPDALFDPRDDMSVLGLLSRYRFTTQESTPDDQSVDPDPELLGRMFENLYQGDERHNTGTYYTPREIVHFMCRQVLDGYLRDTVGIQQETLDWLRQQVTEPDEQRQPLPSQMEDAIKDALERVRICDPAVGSGAFLLGMMQEIVQLRKGMLRTKFHYIDPEKEDAEVASWKRHAIQWSLYGVDINPEAVEICQLRLWLSLVLDLKDPGKVDPLPNLDFRIVAGDSLVDRVADISFKESLPLGIYEPPLEVWNKVAQEEQRIGQLRQEFEAIQDNPARLKELRDRIVTASRKIVRYHLEAALEKAEGEAQMRFGSVGNKGKKKETKANSRVAQLEHLIGELDKHDAYQKPFLWSVGFPEVFQYGGFDIVLANPPYVRQEKLDPDDQESYKLAYKEVFTGTADILVFFYARAIQILKDGGWLSFITSNKYMRAAYGEGLRQFMPEQLRLLRVIDFGDLPLFDANGKTVLAYPSVVVGKKDSDGKENILKVADLTYAVRSTLAEAGRNVNPENVRWVLEDLGGVLQESEIAGFPQPLLHKDRWILEEPTLVRLFDRLMNQGTPLGEFAKGKMYRGILTGLNEAFVIGQTKRNELIQEDSKNAELIKPWLRGRDTKRWRPEWASLFIITIQNSGDADANNPWASAESETEAIKIFKETYPSIYEHLRWWEEFPNPKKPSQIIGLRHRLDRGKYWWELRACAYYAEFAKPKIVWGNLAIESKFAWDSSRAFVGAPANVLLEPPIWLLSIMNSEVANFIYPKITVIRGGGFQEFKTGYISPLPIIAPSTEVQAILSELQNKLTAGPPLSDHEVIGLENEINELVIDIYGLSGSEKAILKEWIELRREQFGNQKDNEYQEDEEIEVGDD